MKFFTHLTIICCLITISCQPSTKSETITENTTQDSPSAKSEVAAVMEKFHQAFKKSDAKMMTPLLSQNGWYCLSNPAELLPKNVFLENMEEKEKLEASEIYPYTIDVQKIRLAEDEQSAIVIEQMILANISPIPMCMTSFLIKSNNEWLIDFANFGLIPPNRDLKMFSEAAVTANIQNLPKKNIEAANLNAEAQKIAVLLNQFHEANRVGNSDELATFLAKDGLFCGTDPGGHMDKETLMWYINELGKSAQKIDNYSINTQKIRLAKNGVSAIAIEQMNMQHIAPIPIRMVSYWVKHDGLWTMDLAMLNFIPTKNILPALNKVSPEYKAQTKALKKW